MSDRYDGGDPASFQKGAWMKDVQGLADEVANMEREEAAKQDLAGNPIHGDPDIRLDWERQQKAINRMKAQMAHLQTKADESDLKQWFGEQLQAGKVVPAEYPAVRLGYLQALNDDRQFHPLMKSAKGSPITRVQIYQSSIERRESLFRGKVTPEQMKALGWNGAGFDQPEPTGAPKEMTPERRQELMGLSAMGAAQLAEEKRNKK